MPADDPDWLNNQANADKAAGRTAQATAGYRAALALRPRFPEALNNLGNLLKEEGQLAEAERCLRAALTLWPEQVDIRNNLGVLCHALGHFQEAELHFRTVLCQQPRHLESLNNLGNLLKDLRRLDEAETTYRRMLEEAPQHPEARWNLSLLLLWRGDIAPAWPLYEARHDPRRQLREIQRPPVSTPAWQGSPLAGRHLLIWPEQGLGDELQFARYLPYLRQYAPAATITWVCKAPLTRLFAAQGWVDRVISFEQAMSTPLAHDCWTLIGSLPHLLWSKLPQIPQTLPYLRAPTNTPPPFPSAEQPETLRVGLVWAGSRWHKNDQHRSLPDLKVLAPLWSVPGIEFISLQHHALTAAPPVAISSNGAQPLQDWGSQFKDLSDSAAALEHLDLLICVDTAIAHLAGALCRPCWVLLPYLGQDWRWGITGHDSLWYPGCVRLFRQARPSDWPGLITEVAAALAQWRHEQNQKRQQRAHLAPADRALLSATVDRLIRAKNAISPAFSEQPEPPTHVPPHHVR